MTPSRRSATTNPGISPDPPAATGVGITTDRSGPGTGSRHRLMVPVPVAPPVGPEAAYHVAGGTIGAEMGLCHDFGSQIADGCNHPMRAGSESCSCDQCGVVCTGRFDGCAEVWARGPHPVLLPPPVPADDFFAPAPLRLRSANGHQNQATAPSEPDELSPPVEAGVPPGTNKADGQQPADARPDDALGSLRHDLQGLQAALAAAVAGPGTDGLEAMVDAAVRKAVRREAVVLGDSVLAVVEGMRRDLIALRQSTEEHFASLHDRADELEAARETPAFELSRLEASGREVVRAALIEEFQPVIEVVAESVAQTELGLAAVDEKLDALMDSTASLAEAVVEMIESLAEGDPAGTEPPAGLNGGPLAGIRSATPPAPARPHRESEVPGPAATSRARAGSGRSQPPRFPPRA